MSKTTRLREAFASPKSRVDWVVPWFGSLGWMYDTVTAFCCASPPALRSVIGPVNEEGGADV